MNTLLAQWFLRVIGIAVFAGSMLWLGVSIGNHQRAQQAERNARAIVKETAQAVPEAIHKSVATETAIASDGARIDALKQQAARRVVVYQPCLEQPHDQRDLPQAAQPGPHPGPGVLVPVLDAGTVRLLNAAATGPLRAAGLGDAQEPAAAAAPR